MGNTFDPDLSAALSGVLGYTDPAAPAPKPKPVPKLGHAAVEAREDNVLRVKFGK